MKKIVTSILGASLLAGALYAAGNTHMGDHMHEGKMMNHTHQNGMADNQMAMMKEMHKECMAFFNSKAKKVEQKSSPETQQRIDSLYEGSDTAGMYRG